MKPTNLKFCAPFNIIYSLNLKNRFLIFLYFIQEKMVKEENHKCVLCTMDAQIKKLGLRISHSKVFSSGLPKGISVSVESRRRDLISKD